MSISIYFLLSGYPAHAYSHKPYSPYAHAYSGHPTRYHGDSEAEKQAPGPADVTTPNLNGKL